MVTLGGKALKANYRLREKDEIEIKIPPAMEPDILPENIPLDILYEDSDVLVVNKPKGMVVHPGAGHYSGTLVNALLYHCGDSLSGINGVMRPGIVHRIDRDTTGSLLVCKNDLAHRSIAEQLKVHSITKKIPGNRLWKPQRRRRHHRCASRPSSCGAEENGHQLQERKRGSDPLPGTGAFS